MPDDSFRFISVYASWYSKAWQQRKLRPSSTVIHIQPIALARWLAISAWCAMVSVTPEVSRMPVLIVGIGHGPIVWNGAMVSAGEPVTPACALGQIAWKSGHRVLWAR